MHPAYQPSAALPILTLTKAGTFSYIQIRVKAYVYKLYAGEETPIYSRVILLFFEHVIILLFLLFILFV